MSRTMTIEKWTSSPDFDNYAKDIIIDIQKRYKPQYDLIEIDDKVDDYYVGGYLSGLNQVKTMGRKIWNGLRPRLDRAGGFY